MCKVRSKEDMDSEDIPPLAEYFTREPPRHIDAHEPGSEKCDHAPDGGIPQGLRSRGPDENAVPGESYAADKGHRKKTDEELPASIDHLAVIREYMKYRRASKNVDKDEKESDGHAPYEGPFDSFPSHGLILHSYLLSGEGLAGICEPIREV